MRVFWIGTTTNINLPDGERDDDMIFLVRAVDDYEAILQILRHFPIGTTTRDLEAWDVTDDEDEDEEKGRPVKEEKPPYTPTCPYCKNEDSAEDLRTTKHGPMCLSCLHEHIDYTNCMGWCSDCYYQFKDLFGG
jgi:hypothetical protein